MSFHFQPQADSSDEDNPIDLSAWKSGAPKPAPKQAESVESPPEDALQVIDELADALNDEEHGDEDDIPTFTGDFDGTDETPAREDSEQVDQFVSTGFTSVNRPAPKRSQEPILLPDSSEDEAVSPVQLPTRSRKSESRRPVAAPQTTERVLVPVVPRYELDSSRADEIIDFTAGDDVVRRVKKEIQGKRGRVSYLVEFEDRHEEEVS